jgi:toxin ParE1/3/4
MRRLRLSAVAENDIIDILFRTAEHYGEIAKLRYERLLVTALQDIAADPGRTGSLARPEIGSSVRSYHLRHSRERARTAQGIVRKPRHLLLYRMALPDVIGVGRVLHEVMDIEQHLPADYGDER